MLELYVTWFPGYGPGCPAELENLDLWIFGNI
jgi:hypothetical protein